MFIFKAVTGRLREVLPKVYGGVSADRLSFSSNRAFDTYNARNINGKRITELIYALIGLYVGVKKKIFCGKQQDGRDENG